MAYNREDNSTLRQLQMVELEVVRIIKRICDKYHIRYYMVGGTMLGAIRHKGFIPWDDDMDIGMPRPDYEKFLRVVQSELPEDYSFLNYKISEGYFRYFSRVVNDNVKVYNASCVNEIMENAWVDIFPFDGMPESRLGKKLHFWYMTAWRFFYTASCFDSLVNLNRPGRPKYMQVMIRLLEKTHLFRNLDTKKLLLHIEKLLLKYDYEKSSCMISFFGQYMEREIVNKRLLGDGALYPFEDMELKGPVEYDAFLTQFYGDYMTPPKDRDKDKHNIVQVVHEK